MKFRLSVLSLMLSLSACKTTNPSSTQSSETTPIKITTVTVAAWKTLSEGKNVVELGCVCEGTDANWNLYRYASASMDVYKITLSEKTALDACIKAKFDGDNCKLKF